MIQRAVKGISIGILCLFALAKTYSLPLLYWEMPDVFVEGQARFPQTVSTRDLSLVVWQESVQREGGLSIFLSLGRLNAEGSWEIRRRILGPWTFEGSEPSIYSLTADEERGTILIAVAAGPGNTELYTSNDAGQSFKQIKIRSGSGSALAPRIVKSAQGSFILFLTAGSDQALSVFYMTSENGQAWSEQRPLIPSGSRRLNLLPTHVSSGSRDYVVYQSMSGGLRPTFQLWGQHSENGGESWSAPYLLTNFDEPEAGAQAGSELWDNQRAALASLGKDMWLVWERRMGNSSPQIYAGLLRDSGSAPPRILGTERVSPKSVHANNPQIFLLGNEPTILWFDNRSAQNRVYMAQREDFGWQDVELSGNRADASFARHVLPASGDLIVFWQAPLQGVDRLYILQPDRSVPAPVLRPQNFVAGKKARRDAVRIAWNRVDDPSGIAGYAWAWSRDPDELPEKKVSILSEKTSIDLLAKEDGDWFFTLQAKDWAGNWSKPSRVRFVRDTTAPDPPIIEALELDENGYALSNTFSLNWQAPEDEDDLNYSWELQFLAGPRQAESLELNEAFSDFQAVARQAWQRALPQARPLGTSREASFTNRDNGLWRFVVTAIDEVGNTGNYAEYYFRLNKFKPYTWVSTALGSVDEQGVYNLRVFGRGYAEDGNITKVYLDRDGKEPYDHEYLLEQGEFSIVGDRELAGIKAEDIEEGRYRIGLYHPVRGAYWTSPIVDVDEIGTIKFGDYFRSWQSSWESYQTKGKKVEIIFLILIAFICFLALGMYISVRGITSVLQEEKKVRAEAMAIITGESMPEDKKEKMQRLKRRGPGLRLKLAGFTTLLAALVVAMVSIPLSYLMIRTQEATLLTGLHDRALVLLESLASGARAYLPSENLLELGFLPAQTSAVPEVRYTTITGFGTGSTVYADHVWATNDPDIEDKIDTASLVSGQSRLEDPLTALLDAYAQDINERAHQAVGEISLAIADLNREGLSLALRSDAASLQKLQDINDTTRTLEARLNENLSSLAARANSYPQFPLDKLDPQNNSYILYKPVLYRQGTGDIYFRGLVRLELSTESIAQELAKAVYRLVNISLAIALVALLMGMLGAQILSSVILSPIKKLAQHVAIIRDTENKADLDGKDIIIKTRDEIALLGHTINDMTQGLVRAAIASQDLTIGKEVQKMFIPLDTDAHGRKLTSGLNDTKYARFFGYYEGAKGVSGDYFDYLALDDNYYAIIKCDVAGKGVPAALIMIEVATLFLNFFKNWKPDKKGLQIETVVYQINDFIESRGFKGRFAAFTLCLFNAQTGLVRFCNAGDNIVHWFDASEKEMKKLLLPETPTAGVFPNMLIEMKGGYQVQTMQLDHGDILLLFTDGIEEAKRRFRDANLNEHLCQEGGAPVDTPHGNHSVGQADEELGYERVRDILNAVLNRGEYRLERYHAPDPSETLHFDFSKASGEVEDAIMALVAVEKIFRMYQDPNAGDEDRVIVDKKVDACLFQWFNQYRSYCAHHRNHPEFDEYMYYTGIKEDEQYDDLTILGIRRK